MKDEMDILQEVATTAAAHGSIALSEMLKKKINLEMPRVNIVSCEAWEETVGMDELVISLQAQILTGLRGKILLILEEKGAYNLIDICYKMDTETIKKGSIFTKIGMSLIKEIGNVVISAYLNALGFYLKKTIIPSLPTLINSSFQEIIRTIALTYSKEQSIMVIETIFKETSRDIKGNFWLILTSEAGEEIKSACKKMLENIQNNDKGNRRS